MLVLGVIHTGSASPVLLCYTHIVTVLKVVKELFVSFRRFVEACSLANLMQFEVCAACTCTNYTFVELCRSTSLFPLTLCEMILHVLKFFAVIMQIPSVIVFHFCTV